MPKLESTEPKVFEVAGPQARLQAIIREGWRRPFDPISAAESCERLARKFRKMASESSAT